MVVVVSFRRRSNSPDLISTSWPLNFPHLYVLSKPHYKPMNKDLMMVVYAWFYLLKECLTCFSTLCVYSMQYLSLSVFLHLTLMSLSDPHKNIPVRFRNQLR